MAEKFFQPSVAGGLKLSTKIPSNSMPIFAPNDVKDGTMFPVRNLKNKYLCFFAIAFKKSFKLGARNYIRRFC